MLPYEPRHKKTCFIYTWAYSKGADLPMHLPRLIRAVVDSLIYLVSMSDISGL